MYEDVPVAQLDRVSASDAEGRGFESLRVRHLLKPPFGGFFMSTGGSNPWIRSIRLKFISEMKISSLFCCFAGKFG